MRVLICYSSKTGNTRKLATAIESITPYACDIAEISPAIFSEISNYDLILIGYWVEGSKADKNTLEFLKQVENKRIALFGTCGTDPEHPYVKSILKRTEEELSNTNELMGHIICRGEIAVEVIDNFEQLVKLQPENQSLKTLLSQFKSQYPGSIGHPNEEDLKKVRQLFSDIFEKLG